jgi:hypothetical protein
MRRTAQSLIVLVLGAVLASAGSARAQSETGLQIGLTGRLAVGVSSYEQTNVSQTGAAATMDADLTGIWRDPRILQFDVKPTVTFGEAPEAEMNNALSGITVLTRLLKGSSMPFNFSYSKMKTPTQDVTQSGIGGQLPTAQLSTSSSVLDADWILRFPKYPTVNLNYRDSNQTSDLTSGSQINDDHSYKEFSARMHYAIAGWQSSAWYKQLHTKTQGTDILVGGVQSDNTTMEEYGSTVTKDLPLHSALNMTVDQTDAKVVDATLQQNTKILDETAALNSQPFKRLNTIVQAQYTGNSQSLRTSSTASPVTTPFNLTNVSGGAGYKITTNLLVTGSLGESSSSLNNSSQVWSIGPSYQTHWTSGAIGVGYAHSNLETRTQTYTEQTNPLGSTLPPTPLVSLSTMYTRGDTGTVSLNQNLPARMQLVATAHGNHGTLEQSGIQYPTEGYGWVVSITRPFGEWNVLGSLSHELADTTVDTSSDRATSTMLSTTVEFRGLNVSAAYQTGSGRAVQLDGQLIWVTSPTSTLGVPTLSSTSSFTASGSYHSRRGRLLVTGNYGRFDYGTSLQPDTKYNIMNIRASYKLRRLRLISGFAKQSQLSSASGATPFNSRVIFFQIERELRFF